MNQYHDIKKIRNKLELVMIQVNLLDDSRSLIQSRLTRATGRHQHHHRYMFEMQLLTTCNVLKMYRCYMMNTWHTLEGLEDDLVEMGYDSDEAGTIVWGAQ